MSEDDVRTGVDEAASDEREPEPGEAPGPEPVDGELEDEPSPCRMFSRITGEPITPGPAWYEAAHYNPMAPGGDWHGAARKAVDAALQDGRGRYTCRGSAAGPAGTGSGEELCLLHARVLETEQGSLERYTAVMRVRVQLVCCCAGAEASPSLDLPDGFDAWDVPAAWG